MLIWTFRLLVLVFNKYIINTLTKNIFYPIGKQENNIVQRSCLFFLVNKLCSQSHITLQLNILQYWINEKDLYIKHVVMKFKNHQDISNVLNCFTSKNVKLRMYDWIVRCLCFSHFPIGYKMFFVNVLIMYLLKMAKIETFN